MNYTHRKYLPHDIHWGDRVKVRIEEVRDFGVFFTYKGVVGFIDWIRLEYKADYRRFTEGEIKQGDEYELSIGIADLMRNNTIALMGRPDPEEIERIKSSYYFLNENFTVGEVITITDISFREMGFFSYTIVHKNGIHRTESSIICYCTDEEKKSLPKGILYLYESDSVNEVMTPVTISSFDDQLMVVYASLNMVGFNTK